MKDSIKRVVITGSTGFLGSRLYLYLKDKYEVILTTRELVDITNQESVTGFLEKTKPDILIHCAAISDTRYAQSHQEEHEVMNVLVPYYLASACEKIGARMIFMSSDQIYNGNTLHGDTYDLLADAAREEIDDCPISVYADGKKRAEKKVLAACQDAVCLRLSWMFDVPREGCKTSANIITNLMAAIKEQQDVYFSERDYRPMTYVQEVVVNIEKMFFVPAGSYNFGGSNTLSSYEIAKIVEKLMSGGVEKSFVQKNEVRFADRARNMTMAYDKINSQGIFFSDAIEGIKSCLE
ncbi:MAG: sugar nucleotide-binding protein [Lachnospiraceae bacterium]